MVAPLLTRPAPPTAEAETRRRLIEAATAVFDEVGFRNATVREICQRADANIAAIHYHFGDKESLYAEVLRHSLREAVEKYPPGMGLGPDATAEERLHAFVLTLLLRIFDTGPHASRSRLMLREMIDPTQALDEIVEREIRPMSDLLFTIIREILGPKATPTVVRRAGLSVVSQAIFYHHCRPLLSRLFPDLTHSHAQIEALARHITDFSLAALKHLPAPKSRH